MRDQSQDQRLDSLKVARTLIRLKHSLKADRELRDYIFAEREALTAGVNARLATSLSEIVGE